VIQIKRVYDPPAPTDGERGLVERLWPRGIKKAALELTHWWKRGRSQHGTAKVVQPRPRKMD